MPREQQLLDFGQSLHDGGEPFLRLRLPTRKQAGVVGVEVIQIHLLARGYEILAHSRMMNGYPPDWKRLQASLGWES